jgi:hypothetical protein
MPQPWVPTYLARHRLDEHANRHARGEGVRVDDHVGDDARLGERHVLGRIQNLKRAAAAAESIHETGLPQRSLSNELLVI